MCACGLSSIEVRHSLDVVVSGQGAVDFDPDQVDYEHGQAVELMAVPAHGWLFSHWEGSLTGSSNPASVEMDGHKSVSAVFTPEQHVVTTSVTGQGTVARNPDQAEYSYGSDVILSAVPGDRGWAFSHWEGDATGITNPVTVEIDGDKSVIAVFTEVPHTLDVSVSGQGTVNVDPDQPEYTPGEEVEVTAVPAAGWLFSHWEGDLTGAVNPAKVTVIGATEVSAQFTSIMSGLVSSFYNSVTINNRVHGMALSLRSTLPVAVNIHRVEVQRPNGTLFASTEDPSILGVLNPGASIGLSVSPAIPPLLSEVRSFTVHWYGTHDGQNFERIGSFTGF